jgi:hypothetical protein
MHARPSPFAASVPATCIRQRTDFPGTSLQISDSSHLVLSCLSSCACTTAFYSKMHLSSLNVFLSESLRSIIEAQTRIDWTEPRHGLSFGHVMFREMKILYVVATNWDSDSVRRSMGP